MEYSIGDLSKITRVGGKTLHQYHLDGLVVPSRIDKFSHRRFYNEKSFHRVEIVRHFQKTGVPDSVIKEILSGHNDIVHLLKNLFLNQNRDIRAWEEYGLTNDAINTILHASSNHTSRTGQIEIKALSDLLVAGKRYKAIPDRFSAHFDDLRCIAGKVICGDPIILFHDDHQFEDEMDMECCLPVSLEVNGRAITCHELPGARAVSVEYEGPSSGVWKAYRKVIDHLNDRNLAIQSPSREIILNYTQDNPTGENPIIHVEIQFLTGDPNDPGFTRDVSRPGFGINANFDL
jgi:effector-binding domain-containing protein